MNTSYIATHLVNLINAPVHLYNENSGRWETFSEGGASIKATEKERVTIEGLFKLTKVDYPYIGFMESDLVFLTIMDSNSPGTFYILGPSSTVPFSESQMQKALRRSRILAKLGAVPTFCALESLISAGLLIYSQLYGREMTISEFWEINAKGNLAIKSIPETLTREIFTGQENQAKHNPYAQELRELESIESGDVFAFNQSISETYSGKIGTLSEDPLRHHKNVAVGNITLASRAAVKGGLSSELSFSMADRFIQEVEKLDNIPEVEMYKRQAQRTYARVVSEEAREKKDNQNILVEKVKDYIFSHLHDNIKITEIAKELEVNPDYLSNLFSREEGTTIKRYILEEKVKRAKNLLRYSDYSLQEISFYLGFSSQSYFSQVFGQLTGMTPAKYRKLKAAGRKSD